MTPETAALFMAVVAGLFGLLIGSFLNVAIHRLPLEDESVGRPRRSRCPSCKKTLAWFENVPLVSWVLQLGRCRGCGWRIPVRYPVVEASTAGLWVLAAGLTGPEDLGLFLVWILVLSGLVVATFVDFDCFEIPDEVSIGGMVLAPIASLLVPALHDASPVAQWMSDGWQAGLPVTRAGALLASLAGMVAGGGVLLVIGWVGKRVYGQDAMGFGDVKLLAAGGGFVGPGGALVALMLGAVLASVVGVLNMTRFFWVSRTRSRRRRNPRALLRTLQVARVAGRYIPFGPYLGMGIGIALLAWNHVVQFLPWPA